MKNWVHATKNRRGLGGEEVSPHAAIEGPHLRGQPKRSLGTGESWNQKCISRILGGGVRRPLVRGVTAVWPLSTNTSSV